ncbi:MAG: thioredoxin domain-containing protein [Elusimicrobia bacterium]|nr:thioredoxin domain-containing protein [Elusimicrobiota bacterium]
MDALRENKSGLFKVVMEANQEEQMRRAKEREEAEKKEVDEAIKNPKKPKITGSTRIRGDKNAKYTLVEYSDFQCPYCSRGFQVVEELRKKYGKEIRFIYKHLPLDMHPQAMPAAQYLEAAGKQSPEKAWQFHDILFSNQGKLGEPFFKETAQQLGLNVEKLEKDAKSPEVKAMIETDIQEANSFGFTGTPGFLLNGVPLRGAYPVEHFDSIIQKIEQKKKG